MVNSSIKVVCITKIVLIIAMNTYHQVITLGAMSVQISILLLAALTLIMLFDYLVERLDLSYFDEILKLFSTKLFREQPISDKTISEFLALLVQGLFSFLFSPAFFLVACLWATFVLKRTNVLRLEKAITDSIILIPALMISIFLLSIEHGYSLLASLIFFRFAFRHLHRITNIYPLIRKHKSQPDPDFLIYRATSLVIEHLGGECNLIHYSLEGLFFYSITYTDHNTRKLAVVINDKNRHSLVSNKRLKTFGLSWETIKTDYCQIKVITPLTEKITLRISLLNHIMTTSEGTLIKQGFTVFNAENHLLRISDIVRNVSSHSEFRKISSSINSNKMLFFQSRFSSRNFVGVIHNNETCPISGLSNHTTLSGFKGDYGLNLKPSLFLLIVQCCIRGNYSKIYTVLINSN